MRRVEQRMWHDAAPVYSYMITILGLLRVGYPKLRLIRVLQIGHYSRFCAVADSQLYFLKQLNKRHDSLLGRGGHDLIGSARAQPPLLTKSATRPRLDFSSYAHLELLVTPALLLAVFDNTDTPTHDTKYIIDLVHHDFRRPSRKFYDIRHT